MMFILANYEFIIVTFKWVDNYVLDISVLISNTVDVGNHIHVNKISSGISTAFKYIKKFFFNKL